MAMEWNDSYRVGVKAFDDQHNEMRSTVEDFREKQRTGKAIVTTKLLLFIMDWWKNHIVKTDKQYSAFFSEKGVS